MATMKHESLVSLIEQLRNLSSTELESQTDRLAGAEHKNVARMIAHIAEVSDRRLHLELGHPHLFDYCVTRLGLREGSAALRIQVSKACRRHPSLLDALAERRLSLTVAGKLAPHLTKENCQRLITECAGMTKRDVEKYLVHLAPKPSVTSGVRRRSASSSTGVSAPVTPVAATAAADSPRSTAKPNPLAAPTTRGSAAPCQPGLYNYRFTADEVFEKMLERLAEVCRMGNAHRNMPAVLLLALNEALDRHDPVRRQARREKRLARKAESEKQAQAEVRAPAELSAETANTAPDRAHRSRHIPAALRDQVLNRAGHRCENRGKDGRRCSARSYLDVDHIMPFGFRGATEDANLRVLCAAHNQLHARDCYSVGVIEQKIATAQGKTPRRNESPPPETASSSRGDGPPRPDEVTFGQANTDLAAEI